MIRVAQNFMMQRRRDPATEFSGGRRRREHGVDLQRGLPVRSRTDFALPSATESRATVTPAGGIWLWCSDVSADDKDGLPRSPAL